MLQELEPLVDGLAGELGRSVLIADRHQRLVAYSVGHDDADGIRVETILNRASPSPMERWVSTLGIHKRRNPTRAPANRELGSAPRVCIPIRRFNRLFGFLWLIDPRDEIGAPEIEIATRNSEKAAEIMLFTERLNDRVRLREGELLACLLGAEGADGPDPSEAAQYRDVFDVDGQVRAVVVALSERVPSGGDLEFAELVEHRARGLWPARRLLVQGHARHHLVLLACGPADELARVRKFGERLRADLQGRLQAADACAVGIGGLQEVQRARVSYEQALRSASVAGFVGARDRVVEWDQLGIYQTLVHLRQAGVKVDSMVERLLERDGDGTLAHTVESYLDLGGDAKVTSERLILHRTSLYYRLHKVEDIVGASLKDGEVRLRLQLGLKLARMYGQLEPPPGGSAGLRFGDPR